MKVRLYRLRNHWQAMVHWFAGYAWSCVLRCPRCKHTVYVQDRRGAGCRWCV